MQQVAHSEARTQSPPSDPVYRLYAYLSSIPGMPEGVANAATQRIRRIRGRISHARIYRLAWHPEVPRSEVPEAVACMMGADFSKRACRVVTLPDLVRAHRRLPHEDLHEAYETGLTAAVREPITRALMRGPLQPRRDPVQQIALGPLFYHGTSGAFDRPGLTNKVLQRIALTWLGHLATLELARAADFHPMLDLFGQGVVPIGRSIKPEQGVVVPATTGQPLY